MGKRLQTIAAQGLMKTLLIIFNTAFWVSLLFFRKLLLHCVLFLLHQTLNENSEITLEQDAGQNVKHFP